jgi:hypothetical protein
MPVHEMVAAAVAMVIEHEGELARPTNPILSPSLVVRSSTSAPAA